MTPIALDWYDLRTNGVPAFERALQVLMNALNRLESQQSIGLHLLDQRLSNLEYLTSEVLMREMLPAMAAERRPMVVELAREVAQLREDLTALAGGTQTGVDPRIGWLTRCDHPSPATRNGTNGTATGVTLTGGGEG
jgi:hypothetical protein